jgi:hypothetical protein
MDIGNTCGRTAAQHGLNLGDTCFGVPAKGKCTRAEVSTGAWLANVNSAAGRHDVLDVGIFYAIGNHPSPTSQMSDGCLDCVFVSIVNNMGGFEVTHEYFRSDSRIDVVNKQLAALNYCAPRAPRCLWLTCPAAYPRTAIPFMYSTSPSDRSRQLFCLSWPWSLPGRFADRASRTRPRRSARQTTPARTMRRPPSPRPCKGGQCGHPEIVAVSGYVHVHQ